MKQLDLPLEDGPQPIRKWLHVWTDAQREKNARDATALETPGQSLPEQAEGDDRERDE